MNDKPKRNFPRVLARIGDTAGPVIRATGREAATLLKLVDKGTAGLRAYDFAGGPPFRLGAYIFDLRGMGLTIRTEREELDRPITRQQFYQLLRGSISINR